MTLDTEKKQEEGLDSRIDRMDVRLKGFIERDEKRTFWKEMIIPLLSLLVALVGITSATIVQVVAIRSQANLKQYEVTFIAKQKAYSAMMSSIHGVYFTSINKNSNENFIRTLDKLQSDTYSIQPFLPISEQEKLWEEVQEMVALCMANYKGNLPSDDKYISKTIKAFTEQRDKIKSRLMNNLF